MPREKAKKKGKTKGGKFRKNGNNDLVLSDADLQFLIEKTSFDAPEIAEWFRWESLVREGGITKGCPLY